MTNNELKKAAFGIFSSVTSADMGVLGLKQAGFLAGEISALIPEGESTRELAHVKGSKAPEGATTGGATGAVLGGGLGWLIGIGSLAIPGVGPLIAAGPIMAALAGASIGTAVGAISGSLIGMGIPEYEAKLYEGHVKDGGVLVSVHCSSAKKLDLAKEVLKKHGATNISSVSEDESDDTDDARPAGRNYSETAAK